MAGLRRRAQDRRLRAPVGEQPQHACGPGSPLTSPARGSGVRERSVNHRSSAAVVVVPATLVALVVTTAVPARLVAVVVVPVVAAVVVVVVAAAHVVQPPQGPGASPPCTPRVAPIECELDQRDDSTNVRLLTVPTPVHEATPRPVPPGINAKPGGKS